ncbi:type II secretion system F family protein [Ramlibacter tataouinensis]|uniref:type II secretion system F family protein n=1 Tax=Ramlibacter tataouinensis TaxID=94132 RepID=UPI0022F39EF3|nr:type II secretion system F family protein [Ramlibacter tataouinensis]WBY02606.1 type II secretion system F family protein [Ramlibacter tataouinensis]
MFDFIEDNSFLALSVLVFIAVVLLLEGLWTLWQAHRGEQARRLRQRLQQLGGRAALEARSRLVKQGTVSRIPFLERHLRSLRLTESIEQHIQQSGLPWTVSGLLSSSALAAAASWFVLGVWLYQPLLLTLIGTALAGAAPWAWLNWRRSRRLGRLQQQLPDALDLMTRALRAGHAFTASLKMAGDELPDPIAGEFRAVHEEITFGVSLQQALTHLSERVPGTDVRFFVVAVLIQRDSGGNLTEILSNLSRLIRERARLMAKVRVLSSEGRLSAWILTLLPFALGGALYLANPKFMGPMVTDPIGQTMLQYLLVMMAFGVLAIRKIVRIRV